MAGILTGPNCLAEVLDVMDRPWVWGQADCCTSACDVFKSLTGIDPMAELRGAYDSDRGAVREILRRGGFVQMARDLAEKAGLRPGAGNPGDIGVTETETGFSLVICMAPGVWAAKTTDGMTTVADVVECWRA